MSDFSCVEVWIGGECHDDDCIYHFIKADTISEIVVGDVSQAVNIIFTDGKYKKFVGLPFQARFSNI